MKCAMMIKKSFNVYETINIHYIIYFSALPTRYLWSIFKLVFITLNNGWTTLTDFIKVERVLPRHRTVESALEEWGPEGLEARLSPASVLLTHTRHPGVDTLAAVHVFYGSLSEEEEHEVPIVKGVHEIWRCKEKQELSISYIVVNKLKKSWNKV